MKHGGNDADLHRWIIERYQIGEAGAGEHIVSRRKVDATSLCMVDRTVPFIKALHN